MMNKKSGGRVPAPRDVVPAEVSPAMQEWAELLVACARDEGVSLTGEGGLLTAMIRQGHCCVKRARARSRSKYAEVPVSNWHQIAWKVRAPQSTGRPGHPRHAVASHNATEPLRFGLSYRELEELLAEHGVDVDHVSLYRWVQRFIPLLIDAARPCRHAVGSRWFVDETYVKVVSVWRYVYRAVDEHGQVIDVLVSKRRDIAAARAFFASAVLAHGEPEEVITDRTAAPANVVAELFLAHGTTPSSTRTTESSATTDV